MKYKLMWSLWPGFIGACALELLFFAAIDPHSLSLFGYQEAMQPGGFTPYVFLFLGDLLRL